MALRNGERQVAPTLEGIREDHRARYEWAADRLQGRTVLDAACGVGYGSKVLAERGATVVAFDRSGEALEYAREHYNHDRRIEYHRAELQSFRADVDAVVCFEALEHIADPEEALLRFRESEAELLFASVPNETVFPHGGRILHHYRHYTKLEFDELLTRAGWRVLEWWGQEGAFSPPERGVEGRTLIAVAERMDEIPELVVRPLSDGPEKWALPGRPLPKSVSIVAMGVSAGAYLAEAAKYGNRLRLTDETWVINAQGGVLQHDRVFLMDDLAIQRARAEAMPEGNVAGQMDWLPHHPGPIYTSRRYEEFPGSVGYPLQWVLNKAGHCYFNSTVPYAVAFAVALGVEEIRLYGCDYSYGDDHAHKREKGRACLEYWIAVCAERGITVSVPETTTLLDARDNVAGTTFYGYDTEDMKLELGPDGFRVERTPLPDERVPTARQMELRYSHDVRYEHLEERLR